MQPPRPIFVLAFATVLVAGGAWAAYEGGKLIRGDGGQASHAAAKRGDVQPIPQESVSTSGDPLDQVLEKLDFLHDPNAFATFDTVLQARLRKGEFEALDHYGDQLVATRARFPGGVWKIARMSESLQSCPGGDDQPERVWKAHLDQLKAWREARPDSPNAPVFSAGAWIGFAWAARGDGYASSVSREGWKDFEDRLATARGLLDAVPSSRRGVLWHRVMQRVALGQSWDRADNDRLFEAAVTLEPAFDGFYLARAQYLMPRWHGEEGDWERFAAESADKLGGMEGDKLYYLILQDQVRYEDRATFFRNPLLSWPRMKRGFDASEKMHGVCAGNLNQFCDLARAAGDRTEAKILLSRLGDDWSRWYWGDAKTFNDYRDWTLQQGKYAEAPAMPAESGSRETASPR